MPQNEVIKNPGKVALGGCCGQLWTLEHWSLAWGKDNRIQPLKPNLISLLPKNLKEKRESIMGMVLYRQMFKGRKWTVSACLKSEAGP